MHPEYSFTCLICTVITTFSAGVQMTVELTLEISMASSDIVELAGDSLTISVTEILTFLFS